MRSAVRMLTSVIKGMFLPVCLILVLQTATSHLLSIPERSLPLPELHKLPLEVGKWKTQGEQTLDNNVTEYLRPDEYILRNYVHRSGGASINLFVAYFKSLQNTYGPHSPRICLPGNGWWVQSSNIVSIQVPGRSQGIPVNEYVLEKASDRILVLYWYQNDRNIWAEEFQAKLNLLPDLIRYRRSDVSLVRVMTPMRGLSTETEFVNCLDFTRSVFPLLAERFGTGH